MHSDINAIMVGYRGMRDMLDSIYGKAEKTGETGEAQLGTRGRAPAPVPKPTVAPITMENWNSVPVDQLPKISPSAFDAMFSPIGKPN